MEKRRFITILVFILIFILCIVFSFLYYKDKHCIIFETGTDEVILTQYVEENGKVIKPTNPSKDGYIFKEWQLNGKSYDFNDEITEDITLTAKWVKEEYITITFETGIDDVYESKKILKGESLNDLPSLIKDGYEFIGWYLNDSLYSGEELYNDVTLVALYNKKAYKVGELVLIVDNYSNSAFSINAYNKKAIGWIRKIKYIIEGSNYPYALGNDNGITGYFGENAIERIE